MSASREYFARVEPLLGRGLSKHRIRFTQLSLTGRVLELLVSCRLRSIDIPSEETPATWPLPMLCRGAGAGPARVSAAAMLKRFMRWKNSALELDWRARGEADLTVAAELLPRGAQPYLRWNRSQRSLMLRIPAGAPWAFLDLSYAAARQARDVLLGKQPWPDGPEYHGDPAWPFTTATTPGRAPHWGTGPRRGAHVMVVGCGSVGSEAIRLLAPIVSRWTLVDAGRVSVFNPVRQWFGLEEVGQAKVEALAHRLTPTPVRPVARHIEEDVGPLDALIATARPDLVLLATGTADHGPMAQRLWQLGIPYVAACAYPQARFFEVSCAIPMEETPCLHCFRGALYRGLESQPPISDEVASFLYSDIDDATRDRLYTDLVAEPASAIETNRIAEVAALLCWEVLSPRKRRGMWATRLLEAETTCLLGANTVERREDGSTAYGIDTPGQVLRLGIEDIAGTEAERRCGVCGRHMQVVHRTNLPQADDDLIDHGLVG